MMRTIDLTKAGDLKDCKAGEKVAIRGWLMVSPGSQYLSEEKFGVLQVGLEGEIVPYLVGEVPAIIGGKWMYRHIAEVCGKVKSGGDFRELKEIEYIKVKETGESDGDFDFHVDFTQELPGGPVTLT